MFLKNKNIIFKIIRSKVTDYAALTVYNLKQYKYFIGLKQCFSSYNATTVAIREEHGILDRMI